jgi:hypothetical protein
LFKLNRFDIENLRKSINEIEVLEREYTGVGFFTTFEKHECLKVMDIDQSTQLFGIGAYINTEKISAGFIFWINKGFLEMIEGCTFLEEWPKNITSYELLVGQYRTI